MVGRAGFEPAKAEPADLQSAPVDHFGTDPQWSHLSDSNRRPTAYKAVALPAELRWLLKLPEILPSIYSKQVSRSPEKVTTFIFAMLPELQLNVQLALYMANN